MSHCASEYTKKLGELSLWSVQVREDRRTHRVLTLAVSNEHRTVTQARGKYNVNPEREWYEPDELWDKGPRPKRWLSAADRDRLRRSRKILEMWLEQERITYSQLGEVRGVLDE